VATGSVDEELLLELELLPHAPIAAVSAASTTKPRPLRTTESIVLAISSPCSPSMSPGAYPGARDSETPRAPGRRAT
jgi:hypothetical protein